MWTTYGTQIQYLARVHLLFALFIKIKETLFHEIFYFRLLPFRMLAQIDIDKQNFTCLLHNHVLIFATSHTYL
jgi:hypothetical protein